MHPKSSAFLDLHSGLGPWKGGVLVGLHFGSKMIGKLSISEAPLFKITYAGVMGCCAEETTLLGFVCFVVVIPRVLSANRVDFRPFFFFYIFHIYPT